MPHSMQYRYQTGFFRSLFSPAGWRRAKLRDLRTTLKSNEPVRAQDGEIIEMVDPETRPWPRIGRAHQPTLEGVAVHAGSGTRHAHDVQLQRTGFEMAPVERHDHSSIRLRVGVGNLLLSQSCALRQPRSLETPRTQKPGWGVEC
jgi:hypothetical protein